MREVKIFAPNILTSTDILILGLKVLSEIICNDILLKNFQWLYISCTNDQELFIGRISRLLQWDTHLPALTGFAPLHKLYIPSSHPSPSCTCICSHLFPIALFLPHLQPLLNHGFHFYWEMSWWHWVSWVRRYLFPVGIWGSGALG